MELRMNYMLFSFFLSVAYTGIGFASAIPEITNTPLHQNTSTITVTIPLKNGDWLYKEYLDFSIDHPGITLSDWKADHFATPKYDSLFQETKKVFTHPITVTMQATFDSDIPCNTHLHINYYLKSEKKLIKKVVPLSFHHSAIEPTKPQLQQTIELPSNSIVSTPVQQHTIQSQQDYSIGNIPSFWSIIILISLIGIIYLSFFMKKTGFLSIVQVWSIEIKRLFIFLLLPLVVYGIHSFIPSSALLLIIALLFIIIGIIYFYTAKKESSHNIQKFKNYIGYVLLASSVFVFFKAAQLYYDSL